MACPRARPMIAMRTGSAKDVTWTLNHPFIKHYSASLGQSPDLMGRPVPVKKYKHSLCSADPHAVTQWTLM